MTDIEYRITGYIFLTVMLFPFIVILISICKDFKQQKLQAIEEKEFNKLKHDPDYIKALQEINEILDAVKNGN